MKLGEAEVSGVRVLWNANEGPLTACLRFGVGWNDERLAEHGVTHAVEHMALRTVGSQAYAWNGTVDAVSTNFSVTGSPDEVVTHLATVCRNLTDLPTSGLSNELSVMRVEAEKRTRSHLATDLGLRFGASGPGLVDWAELGFRHLTPPDLRSWSERWFTTANAVLWLSGPPPASLELPLTDGARVVHDVHPSRLGGGRYWVPRDTSSVSVSTLNEADPAHLLAMSVARERIFERLRTRLAVSYDVSLSSQQVSPTGSLQLLRADGSPDAGNLILTSIIESLDELVDSGPTEAELDLVRDRMWRGLESEAGRNGWLHRSAGRILFGRPVDSVESERSAIQAFTPSDVADALRSSMNGLVAIGPKGLGGVLPGWSEPPSWSTETVSGTTFEADNRYTTGKLVVGDHGISWVRNQMQRQTVRWTDLAACLAWDDGSRSVVGSDGTSIRVNPWSWSDTGPAPDSPIALVDRACSPELRVPMGPGNGRPSDRPPTTAEPSKKSGYQPLPINNKPWARFVRTYALYIIGGCVFLLAAALGLAWGAIAFVVIVAITVPTTRKVMRRRLAKRTRSG